MPKVIVNLNGGIRLKNVLAVTIGDGEFRWGQRGIPYGEVIMMKSGVYGLVVFMSNSEPFLERVIIGDEDCTVNLEVIEMKVKINIIDEFD